MDGGMAVTIISWLFAIPLLGFATGLRTFTPLALLCWYARLGYLPTDGTWASWTGRLGVALAVTVLAVGELIGDKLPKTPNRTDAAPLIARVGAGGLCGAICATAMSGPGLEGLLLGVVGTVVGAFSGFMVRREVVERLCCKDWPIALVEDLFTIAAAAFALHVITN
jgi:uncharacterized membrane protein